MSRCAVYLAGNPAQDCGTHWCGGPDFAVEVISRDDRAYEKIPFYAEVDTREALLIERTPWKAELMRLSHGDLISAGVSDTEDQCELFSAVLPIAMRMIPSDHRPHLEIRHIDSDQRWKV